MKKKEYLKTKKDKIRAEKRKKREIREHKLFMKSNYQKIVSYGLDCFFNDICDYDNK